MNDMRLIDANALDAELKRVQESLETGNDRKWELNKGQHKGIAWARAILRDAPEVDAVPRWIPVTERLPDADPERTYTGYGYKYSQDLLVHDGDTIRTAYYCHNTGEWRDNRWEDDIVKVKYWAIPLPEPATGKEGST